MKKLITLFVIIALPICVFTQSPDKMSYQCVVRNTTGGLVTNHAIGMKISILQGSASGTVVFSETYSPAPQTNANGLVTVEIGSGTPVTGTFTGINWAAGPYYLKTETDPTGGTSYTISGTSQLLSVPYAIYSKTAQTADYNSLSNLPTLNINNWNTAYGWGNHAGLYRVSSWVPAWIDVTGKPTFATVATSGSYNDLINKPTILNSQWTTLGSNIYYNSGNVGIGTTNPGGKLQVQGDIVLPYNSGNSVLTMVMGKGNSMYIKPENDLLRITSNHTNNPTVMWLNKAGEVGIASTLTLGDATANLFYGLTSKINFKGTFGNPSVADLVPRSFAQIEVGSNTGQAWDGAFLRIMGFSYDNGTPAVELLRVNTYNGNVGIGTTNPGVRLDVNGDIRSANKIWADVSGATGSYFRGGNDAELWDVGIANTLAIYGVENNAVATLRLGSSSASISGSVGNIGIGTTAPTSAIHISTSSLNAIPSSPTIESNVFLKLSSVSVGQAMLFDWNNIQTIGAPLRLNAKSIEPVNIGAGGGGVAIGSGGGGVTIGQNGSSIAEIKMFTGTLPTGIQTLSGFRYDLTLPSETEIWEAQKWSIQSIEVEGTSPNWFGGLTNDQNEYTHTDRNIAIYSKFLFDGHPYKIVVMRFK